MSRYSSYFHAVPEKKVIMQITIRQKQYLFKSFTWPHEIDRALTTPSCPGHDASPLHFIQFSLLFAGTHFYSWLEQGGGDRKESVLPMEKRNQRDSETLS